MYNHRSRVIKGITEVVLDRYGGDLGQVLLKPHEEAKEELMTLPGVGLKTADVLLMFDAGKAIIPVDKHIFRITKRLEMVSERASYDQVRMALEAAAPPGRHKDAHMFIIRFKSEVCKAQRPRCTECFLNDLCLALRQRKTTRAWKEGCKHARTTAFHTLSQLRFFGQIFGKKGFSLIRSRFASLRII
jgi:endonuclease-3